MIAMCCRLPSTTTSATITSADANPSPSATHARSSNQVGATRKSLHDGGTVRPCRRSRSAVWQEALRDRAVARFERSRRRGRSCPWRPDSTRARPCAPDRSSPRLAEQQLEVLELAQERVVLALELLVGLSGR